MRARTSNNGIVNDIKSGKKKWVRYAEGAQLYSLGVNTFIDLAKEAKATYHLKKIVLVNTELVDEYLEAFKDEF